MRGANREKVNQGVSDEGSSRAKRIFGEKESTLFGLEHDDAVKSANSGSLA